MTLYFVGSSLLFSTSTFWLSSLLYFVPHCKSAPNHLNLTHTLLSLHCRLRFNFQSHARARDMRGISLQNSLQCLVFSLSYPNPPNVFELSLRVLFSRSWKLLQINHFHRVFSAPSVLLEVFIVPTEKDNQTDRFVRHFLCIFIGSYLTGCYLLFCSKSRGIREEKPR